MEAENLPLCHFDKISNELLMSILSFVDLKCRIRSERVSTRFQECINRSPSWKFDQNLILDPSTNSINGSEDIRKVDWCRVVRKILESTKIYSLVLKFSEQTEGEGILTDSWLHMILSQFWVMPTQVELRRLVLFEQNIYNFIPFAQWCLVSNRNTLKDISIELRSMGQPNSYIDNITVINSLIMCNNMQILTLGGSGISVMGEMLSRKVLRGKSLEKITLYYCSLSCQNVADICNLVSNGKLRSFSFTGIKKLFLGDLTDLLYVTVREGLTHIRFETSLQTLVYETNYDTDLHEMLPLLPSAYPNVELFEIGARAQIYRAEQIIPNLNSFMNECKNKSSETNLIFTTAIMGFEKDAENLLNLEDTAVIQLSVNQWFISRGKCSVKLILSAT